MNLEFKTRRVITGHNAEGKAVIVADDLLAATVRAPDKAGGDRRVSGIELWGTTTSPVDNSDPAMAAQARGFQGHTEEGKGQRSKFRIGRFAPGHIAPMHRTESVDYAILIEGECDLLLDGGEATRLHAGDVVIQRGTMHSWVNRGETPCTWFFVLLDANPVTVAGTQMKQAFSDAPDIAKFAPK